MLLVHLYGSNINRSNVGLQDLVAGPRFGSSAIRSSSSHHTGAPLEVHDYCKRISQPYYRGEFLKPLTLEPQSTIASVIVLFAERQWSWFYLGAQKPPFC